jgi:16S rRNA (adenine1518-N6/adenine1519-N6)-dimethyltransferase
MQSKKSLGQHFLTSTRVAARIAEAATLSSQDTVLEIGPGKGILTHALLQKAGNVIAIEKDRRLLPFLSEKFAHACAQGILKLIHGDILTQNLSDLGLADHSFKIVANIPYYITGELIQKTLSGPIQPAHAVLLVQKEVAERIAKDKKGSILSMSVHAYGVPRYISTVPAQQFRPKPKVDSAILSISEISRDNFKDISEQKFFTILKTGFAHKRKKLFGNLEKLIPQGQLEDAFTLCEIDLNVRAEELSISEWFQLVRAIYSIHGK